jgi:AcrR family transcriptional regulator
MSSDLEQNERRNQILEAALKVFSAKGFQQATNKDIAKAAGGISPGLIYHYFKDKEDLFFTIFRERAAIIQLVSHPEEFAERPPREVLTMIGRSYMASLRTPGNIAFFRIVLGEIFRFPQIGETFYREIIAQVFMALKGYLQSQIDRGTLKPHNPEIAARSFMGMFMAHILLRELFRQPEAIATSEDLVIQQAVDLFLNGLESQPTATP